MTRKIIRAGMVAVLAGSAIVAAVPAQASQIRPRVNQGDEYIDTYYSNAQETIIVGKYAWGSCGNYSTGDTDTPYYTLFWYNCASVGEAGRLPAGLRASQSASGLLCGPSLLNIL